MVFEVITGAAICIASSIAVSSVVRNFVLPSESSSNVFCDISIDFILSCLELDSLSCSFIDSREDFSCLHLS